MRCERIREFLREAILTNTTDRETGICRGSPAPSVRGRQSGERPNEGKAVLFFHFG